MAETQSKALAVRSSASMSALDELDEILLTGELETEYIEDPAEIQRSITQRILTASSDEELESIFGGVVGWREYEGVPIRLHGFHWQRSGFDEGGAAVYFVVKGEAVGEDGSLSPVTLTTGSANVLAQLSNYARRGVLEGKVVVLEKAAKPTKSGFYPYWLVSPEEATAA